MSDPLQANMYTLQGNGLHVTYAGTSFAGGPILTYQDAQGAHTFRGNQLNSVETPIGTLVTATIHMTVDTGSTSFSVLIPRVNIAGTGQTTPVHTDGVTTVHRFGPTPQFRLGQMEVYTFTKLHGTASFIVA